MCRRRGIGPGTLSLLALVLLVATVVFPPHAHGQDDSEAYAFVMYAEGYDMTVFRNGELTTYDVLVDDVIGMPLLPGDLVQTDADTFVEIQVMPARTVVKVAENTTFEIESIGGSGGGTFNMTYGRLRAKVERVTREDPFEVRGFSAVAGVRGTDFGFDSVVDRAQPGELNTRVYVFEGEVDVSDRPDPAAEEEPQIVRISRNEMVNVLTEVPEHIAPTVRDPDLPEVTAPAPDEPQPDVVPAQRVVFRRESLVVEIQEFWIQEDFREEAIDPDLVEERFPGINARVRRLNEERQRYEELQRLRREGLLSDRFDRIVDAEADSPPTEPEREPVGILLDEPRPDESPRRIMLTPQEEERPSVKRRARLAGHWLTGIGVAFEVAGAAFAWYGEGYREPQDLSGGGPSVGLIAGGGVFITSGLISYIVSIIAD